MAELSSYQPLDQEQSRIRLLEYVSEPGDTHTSLRLSTVSLDDHPDYTCLSYVWGDPTLTQNITLDDHLCPVTENLVTALRFLQEHWQHAFPDRALSKLRLWVDALCINQQDVEERNIQVGLMRQLYSEAQLVLCWVSSDNWGWEDTYVHMAIQNLRIMHKEIQQMLKGRDLGDPSLSVEDMIGWLAKYPNPSDAVYWNAENRRHDLIHKLQLWKAGEGPVLWSVLSKGSRSSEAYGSSGGWDAGADLLSCHEFGALLSLQYWKRTWILQEVALARNAIVVCRRTSIEWEKLKMIAAWRASVRDLFTHLGTDGDVRLQQLAAAWGVILDNRLHGQWEALQTFTLDTSAFTDIAEWKYPEVRKWLVGFTASASLEAGDPRDHVYGLLGITKISISVDYKKPLEDVYCEYIEAYLHDWGQSFSAHAPELLFLRIARGSEAWKTSIPSWAPTSRLESVSSYVEVPFRNRSTADHNCFPAETPGAKIADKMLFISCIGVDVVEDFKGVDPDEPEPPFIRCLHWHGFPQLFQPSNEPLLRVLFRTILWHTLEKFPDPYDAAASHLVSIFLSLLAHQRDFGTEWNWADLGLDYSSKPHLARSLLGVFFPGSRTELDSNFIDGVWGIIMDGTTASSVSLDAELRERYPQADEEIYRKSDAQFFITESGYIGIVRKSMGQSDAFVVVPGDILCVAKGSTHPCIVRERDDHYTFVCATWVYGLEKGQARELLRGGDAEIERIAIG